MGVFRQEISNVILINRDVTAIIKKQKYEILVVKGFNSHRVFLTCNNRIGSEYTGEPLCMRVSTKYNNEEDLNNAYYETIYKMLRKDHTSKYFQHNIDLHLGFLEDNNILFSLGLDDKETELIFKDANLALLDYNEYFALKNNKE